MPEVEKSVLVAHTPERMFNLVDRVEDYPAFLPWCGGTALKLRDAHKTIATIHIAYMGVRQSFTTENIKEAGRMHIHLQEGPFSELEGTWDFVPLGDHACKVIFRLRYKFSSHLLESLLTPVFNYITHTLVDAFMKRADVCEPT